MQNKLLIIDYIKQDDKLAQNRKKKKVKSCMQRDTNGPDVQKAPLHWRTTVCSVKALSYGTTCLENSSCNFTSST